MADTFTKKGYDGSAWDIDLSVGGVDFLSPHSAVFGDAVPVGGFQDSTHLTDSGMASDGCDPDHIRNCKYDTPTTVSLNGGAPVTLNFTNVGDTDTTIRWSYNDSAGSTVLSNVLLFAYDGSTPATPPVGVKVLAFERRSAEILKDLLSDTPGDGGAWDSAAGIGGSADALICSDRTSVATHYFYFGLSFSPTSKGVKTLKLRLEFDAQ
jgi:hypothetical protein